MEFRIKNFIIFFSLFFFLVPIVKADDPYLTDNPETLEPADHYIVFYSSYYQYKFGKYLDAPAIEYDLGIAKNLEFEAYIANGNVFDAITFPSLIREGQHGHTLHNATGLGDVDLALKYRFIQESKYVPQVGFMPNFIFPTGSYNRALGNGRIYWYPAIGAQKTIDKWLMYGTVAYVINNAKDFNKFLFEGFVLQNQLTDRLALGMELFHQGRSDKFIRSSTLLNLGTQFEIEKGCTLFFSLGHSIQGENTLIGYFGIGWGGKVLT